MEGINQLLNGLSGFILLVIANFVAILIWNMISESASTNVLVFRRMKNWRYNCLAFVYKEIRNIKLNDASDEEIQNKLIEKYNNKSFPFMHHLTGSQKEIEDLAFIWNVINNKEALFSFFNTAVFGKKEYEEICRIIKEDENKKDARSAFYVILKDKSPNSIDKALIWFPKIMTEDIRDMDNPDKEVGSVERTYTPFYLFKGVYFDDNLTVEQYKDALKIIQKQYPNMKISFGGHSSDYSTVTIENYSRGKDILNVIKSIL